MTIFDCYGRDYMGTTDNHWAGPKLQIVFAYSLKFYQDDFLVIVVSSWKMPALSPILMLEQECNIDYSKNVAKRDLQMKVKRISFGVAFKYNLSG